MPLVWIGKKLRPCKFSQKIQLKNWEIHLVILHYSFILIPPVHLNTARSFYATRKNWRYFFLLLFSRWRSHSLYILFQVLHAFVEEWKIVIKHNLVDIGVTWLECIAHEYACVWVVRYFQMSLVIAKFWISRWNALMLGVLGRENSELCR